MKNIAIVTILGLVSSVALDTQASLVANWDIEEGSGTTTTEAVSNTDGALGTGVSWSTDTPGGPQDYSLSFPDTTAGHVKTGLNAGDLGIDGTGAKTITGWFKTSSQSQQMFFGYSPSNGLGAGNDLRLGHDDSGYLRFEVSSGFALYNGATVDDNAWHMAAIVISSGDTTDDVEFYLDGDLLTPTSSNGRAINTLASQTQGAAFDEILIGNGNPATDTQAWDGLIDNVRVYDTALTETQLDGLYTAIPEPTTLGVFALFGLAYILRRRING